MATYYEMLKVQPTATPAEIEAAIDTQYNQYRRLVTHHDPAMVAQATQAMQILEQIRTTLSDPVKRAGYDAGIGIGGVTGGLFDPSAALAQAAPPMAPPPPRRTENASLPNLWECPKCQTKNPEHTKHCLRCGTDLVLACPFCQEKAVLATTKFCGNCGYHYDVATHRNELLARQSNVSDQASKVKAQISELLLKQNVSIFDHRSVPMMERVKFGLLAMIPVVIFALCGMSIVSPNDSFLIAIGLPFVFVVTYFVSTSILLRQHRERVEMEIDAVHPRLKQYEDQWKQIDHEIKRVEANKRTLL